MKKIFTVLFLTFHFLSIFGQSESVESLSEIFVKSNKKTFKNFFKKNDIKIKILVLPFLNHEQKPDEFSDNILDTINPFQGGSVGISGLSMMGGVVLALLAAALFFKIKKINPWPICDAMMPLFALGLGIARVGCFLNGCCYGLPTHEHIGMVFPSDTAAGFHFPDMPLIPTQLYSSLAGFAILTIVLVSEKIKKFDGHSFWLTMGLYGIWRFIIDFFRYYEDSMVMAVIVDQPISRNQILSLLLTLIAAIAIIRLYLKWKKENKYFSHFCLGSGFPVVYVIRAVNRQGQWCLK